MHAKRRGISLMEVLVSTSILVASSIVLVELATIGRKQANAAYDLNTAQLLCQAKLDEIVTGISPLQAVEDQELDDDSDWLYSVELEPKRTDRLISVKVAVYQKPREHQRSQRFTLVRWMPDQPENSPKETPTQESSNQRPPTQRRQREEGRR